jgi:heptosyltransferase-3
MNPASLLPDLPSGSRILLIRLRSLGDIVLLTPSLRLLKEWRSDLQISVMIESRFHDLLRGNPYVAEILSPGEEAGLRRATTRLHAIHRLRAKKFALCANLHGGPTSGFLTRFSGARWKAGFAHFRSCRLYDFLIPDAREILKQEIVHTAEHHAAAFFWMGLPRRPIPPTELYVSDAARAAWQMEMRRLGMNADQGYALIHPTALYQTKQWPAERFAQLGRHLNESHRLIPVFSCGPGETGVLDTVERATGGDIRRVEGPRLDLFMAAIAGCKLFIGNDSGPAHIAAALRRPLVVIFGSSNSRIWRPWTGSPSSDKRFSQGAGNFRIVQNFYECNPCPGDRCYRYEQSECILSVTYEQVRAAVDSLMESFVSQNTVVRSECGDALDSAQGRQT